MNAPVSIPTPSEIEVARRSLEQLSADIRRWESALDKINHGVVADPNGDRGADLESLILRGQHLVASNVRRLTGMGFDDLCKVMGVQ